jgi:excisionase family DNA binding protein
MTNEGTPRSAPEVARALGCSISFVYRLAREGRLTYIALGEQGPGRRTAMRFPAEAVAAFIRARTISARVEPVLSGKHR